MKRSASEPGLIGGPCLSAISHMLKVYYTKNQNQKTVIFKTVLSSVTLISGRQTRNAISLLDLV